MFRHLCLFLAMTFHLATAAAAEPPVNDRFADALDVPPGRGYFGTLSEATPDPAEFPAAADMATPVAVWYAIRARADGILVVDTSGSDSARSRMRLRAFLKSGGGQPVLMDESGPKPLGNPGSRAIALVKVFVAKGDVLTVGVADDSARIPADSAAAFRLNIHALPQPTPDNRNFAVLSPTQSFVLGAAAFDSPERFRFDLPNIISVAPVEVDEPTLRTGFSGLRMVPDRTGKLRVNEGVSAEMRSTGSGPKFGEAGTFVSDAVIGLSGVGLTWGRQIQRMFVFRFSSDFVGNVMKISLGRRSDADRIGNVRRFDLTVSNISDGSLRGCFVYANGYSFAAGIGNPIGLGQDFEFRAYDAATGKAMADWNRPVNIAKGRRIEFKIAQTVTALGLQFTPLAVACAEPYAIAGPSRDGQIASGTLVGWGYPASVSDAVIEPTNAPGDIIRLKPGKSREIVYTVRNAGKKRRLTILPTDRLPGIPNGFYAPVAVSRKICAAYSSGRCSSSFRSSVSLDFAAGQTRTFKVRWTRSGDLPANESMLFTIALDAGRPVGAAGIAVSAP